MASKKYHENKKHIYNYRKKKESEGYKYRSFWLPQDTIELLDNLSKQKNISRASVLNFALRTMLKKKKGKAA